MYLPKDTHSKHNNAGMLWQLRDLNVARDVTFMLYLM